MSCADRVHLKKLTVKEVICPICREIFIEPVSLPCKHIVCLQCLEQTVENNTLCCPICRSWIGTYLRLAKNRNKIVNQKLWEQLKKQFPKEIERKRNGEDDGISDKLMEDQPRPSLSNDRGSIKKEFDELFNKLKKEEEKYRQAEQSASEKFAMQLMEEEYAAAKLRLMEEREIAARDALLVKTMVEDENWEPDDMQADSTSNDDEIDMENGRDSISIEFRHFTPICIVPKTPPKLLPNGQVNDTKILKPKNLSRSLNRSRRTGNKNGLSLQNKTSLKVSSNNFMSIQAIVTASGPADTTTQDDLVISKPEGISSPDGAIPRHMIEEHRRLEQKLLQEKADYSLAIKLQRRWSRTPVKRQHSHTYSLRSAKKRRDGSS